PYAEFSSAATAGAGTRNSTRRRGPPASATKFRTTTGKSHFFHARINHPELRAGILGKLQQRKEKSDFSSAQGAQHCFRRTHQCVATYSKMNSWIAHVQPTFCATYGAKSERTVWSTRVSEK